MPRLPPDRDRSGEPINLWDALEGRWLGQADYLDQESLATPRRCCATLSTGARCPFWSALPFRMCSRHLETSDRLKVMGAQRYEMALGGKSTLRETFAKFLMDPNIGDITPELALQRTLLQSVLNDAMEDGDRVTKEYISALTHMIREVSDLADKHSAIAHRKGSLSATQAEYMLMDLIEATDVSVHHVVVRLLGGFKENEPLITALHHGILTTLADSLERTVRRGTRSGPALTGRDTGEDLRAFADDGGGGREVRGLGEGGLSTGEGPEGRTD